MTELKRITVIIKIDVQLVPSKYLSLKANLDITPISNKTVQGKYFGNTIKVNWAVLGKSLFSTAYIPISIVSVKMEE